MDQLGVDGNKLFSANNSYTKYTFQDIQKLYDDMITWNDETEISIEDLINPYRLTGQDGSLLQNMYTTYKDQLIIEGVSSPNRGAYNILLNKIKLALAHPELSFNILNVKDETGNSLTTVGLTQLNSNQLAHAQALYNKNNDTYIDYPPEILEALGLNPNLSNGTLTNNENVGSNVVGGQEFTDDQVDGYANIIDAADDSVVSNYGLIQINTNSSASNELPDTVVQTPGIKEPDSKAGGNVGSGGK